MDVGGESMNTLSWIAEQIKMLLQQINADKSIKGVVVISGKRKFICRRCWVLAVSAASKVLRCRVYRLLVGRHVSADWRYATTFVARIHGPALGGGFLELALAVITGM